MANHEHIIECIKLYHAMGLKINISEIAKLSGVSRSYMRKFNIEQARELNINYDVMEDAGFSFCDMVEWETNKTYHEEKIFNYLLENMVDKTDITEYMGIIFAMIYRTDIFDTNWLYNVSDITEACNIGKHVIRLYYDISNGKREPKKVHSKHNANAKYLLKSKLKDNLHIFFNKERSYIVGEEAKKWSATDELEFLVKVILEEKMLDEYLLYVYSNSSHMCTLKCAKIIEITFDEMKQFSYRSKFCLLASTVNVVDDRLYVEIKHKARTDEEDGRSYNVFAKISSEDRLLLGYTNYDMSAALQTISLHLIGVKSLEDAKKAGFEMLWSYATNKDYKISLRQKIADDLNWTVDAVKECLTSYSNECKDYIYLHDDLNAFYKESVKLSRAVITNTRKNDNKVLTKAQEQSRKAKRSSIFFFVWTHYERKIRHAMLSILTDGIELHDAVYSKINVDTAMLEKVIYDETGFNIIIGTEQFNKQNALAS